MDNFDDSYILKIHKEMLVEDVYNRITKNPDYEAYDNIMISILCKDMYAKVVNGMNKEQYLREIEEDDERKNNLFAIQETPHIKGVVIENIEPEEE